MASDPRQNKLLVVAVAKHLEATSGQNPAPEDIAAIFGTSPDYIAPMLTRATLLSTADRLELNETLEPLLQGLGARSERILELRYGLRGHREYTRREVGRIFGLSSSRIGQLERSALLLLGRKAVVRTGRPLPDESLVSGEALLGLIAINDQLRVVELNRDGTYRFIDGTERLHGLLYISPESIAWKETIEELEHLINDSSTSEHVLQVFFEQHPELLLGEDYKKIHPHVCLDRQEGSLIPDFLLEPYDEPALCDILDLKLPASKVYVMKRDRARYSSAVQEAAAQLREYSAYFEDTARRELVAEKYGLHAYRPRLIVIIGRRATLDPIVERRIESGSPQLVLRTYDDVIARARRLRSINR